MEEKNKTFHRKKTVWAFVICLAVFVALTGRLVYLMVYQSAYYTQAAEELHQRERNIKAKREDHRRYRHGAGGQQNRM